jgi:hypothetical protein
VVPPQKLSSEDLSLFMKVEEKYLEEKTHPLLVGGDQKALGDWQEEAQSLENPMRITGETWRSWFDAQRPGSLGMALKKALDPGVLQKIKGLPNPGEISWRRSYRMLRRP